ncbi:MAG: inositol monophosphatase family protein, partial [Acidobacteria bacterium]|nr:inositol monophosphatase family protein [Acidobacteriota bacterium]
MGPRGIVTLTDLEIELLAAEAGSEVLRRKYGSALVRITKTSLDFATDADVDAENSIVEVIRASRPSDRVVAEESGSTGDASSDRAWLVDPLCGTLNFAAHTPLVALNVSLMDRGQSIVVVCADPLARELMWTDGSAAVLHTGGHDQALQPSSNSKLVDINLDGPFPNSSWFRAIDLLGEPSFSAAFRPRVSSTSLALAWVAAGRRAAYVTDGSVLNSVHLLSARQNDDGADTLADDLA